jgi:cytochrome c553
MKNKIFILLLSSIFFIGCSEEKSTPTTNSVAKAEKIQESQPVKKEKVEPKATQVEKKPEIKSSQKETDGIALYKKCAGCHGSSGQKVALDKSKVIKGWDATKIANAIQGYQNGTYGGTMKGIMKSQVSSLDEKQIDILAKHIASF